MVDVLEVGRLLLLFVSIGEIRSVNKPERAVGEEGLKLRRQSLIRVANLEVGSEQTLLDVKNLGFLKEKANVWKNVETFCIGNGDESDR